MRGREPIRRALRRELLEEIGLPVTSARIIDIFDRPQKAAIAILFQVTLRKGRPKLQEKEILDVAFMRKLPASSTPSVRYFWQRQFPGRNSRSTRPLD